jgi:uncharacterized NAD(P)/FAD-binding protein YdhS
LRVAAGRISRFVTQGSHAEVIYMPRHGKQTVSVQAARVINCTGPAADWGRVNDPLIRNLLRDGIVRPDPLRLALDVTTLCALRGDDGRIASNLFAVGPITRSAFWEMTAVPDIRRQCEFLAAHISELPSTGALSAVSSARVPAM